VPILSSAGDRTVKNCGVLVHEISNLRPWMIAMRISIHVGTKSPRLERTEKPPAAQSDPVARMPTCEMPKRRKELRLSGDGRQPRSNTKKRGAIGASAHECVARSRDRGRLVAAQGRMTMLIFIDREAPSSSFAVRYKTEWPRRVGLPVMRPVFGSSCKPAGSAPRAMLQVRVP
jgi:hypothetical protein